MLADDLISFHSLHQFTLRIDIVERNLHELNFRVLCQDPIQEFCRGMEGKAQMFDLSFCFPLVCMIKEVRSLYDAALAVNAVIINRLEIMQQIIIDIVHAEVLKLLGKNWFDLAFFLQAEGRELCGNSKSVAWITLHDRFACRLLALSIVVHVAGVEVSVTRPYEGIHHLVQFIIVEICRVSVFYRKPHHAKTKSAFQCHAKLLSSHKFLMYR